MAEVYGTASDGTVLHWDVYTPSTPGPWPVVLVIHGGGFVSGSPTSSPESVTCARDLAGAGYLALSIEYRLAPPGSLPGQVSDGRFPQQTNDVNLAVRTARADPRCNGQVGAIGGSAGGYHTAFAATNGTPGEDRIDVGVCLSGAFDLSDFSPNPNIDNFTNFVTNYVGVTTAGTTSLRTASPAWLLGSNTAPLYLVNTVEDPMPYSQLPDFVAKLDAASVTNYQAQSLPGNLHSFAYWPTVKDHSLAFIGAIFAHTTPPPLSPPPAPGSVGAKQLLNVSTRAQVKMGDGVMIGGFIVTGDTAKRLVLRAIGPSLAQDGVSGVLGNPLLQLFDSKGVLVESNDNWTSSDNSSSDLGPGNPAESLLTAILPPDNYTAIVSGVGSSEGVALFELYDVDPADSHVSNISTRGQVGTGTDVIIGGFIIGGTEPTRVVVRALGPSLSSLGVAGALQDPGLELRDSNGTLLFSNDNWQSTQEQQITASGLAPSDPREPAILATLPPGTYTALVSGVGNTTGVSLVEVYDLENR
ncbi:MAG: alpha/beta hydrolase [Chthoniobacterales bacterium]|nr:alpha/beta hydrolase [Chthoniobacterales bacterium]